MKRRIYTVLMLVACCAHTLDAQKGGRGGGRGRGQGGASPVAAGRAVGRAPSGPSRAAARAIERPAAPQQKGPVERPAIERPRVAERAPRAARPEVSQRIRGAERVAPTRQRPLVSERVRPERPSRRVRDTQLSERRPRAERGLGRRERDEDRAAARARKAERRERRATERRQPRDERRRAERPDRIASVQSATPAQQRELTSKPAVANVNRFAEQKIAQSPKLQAEVQQARTRWHTDSRTRHRWHSDWRRYSYYHSHGHFHFDTFIHFAFFAPWYLFPFSFYPTFFNYYPVYWVPFGWFSYPIYWDYGYASEIRLVQYVEREDFDAAIDRLERRLDELENDLLAQRDEGTLDEQSITTLRAKISEMIWLLNDLKRIILDKARISRSRKNELAARIDSVKNVGHNLMSYFEG